MESRFEDGRLAHARRSLNSFYCWFKDTLSILSDEKKIVGIAKQGIFSKPKIILENIETHKMRIFKCKTDKFTSCFHVNEQLDLVLTENGNFQLVCFGLFSGTVKRVFTNDCFEKIYSYSESPNKIYAFSPSALIQLSKSLGNYVIISQVQNPVTEVCSSLYISVKKQTYLFYIFQRKVELFVLEIKEKNQVDSAVF